VNEAGSREQAVGVQARGVRVASGAPSGGSERLERRPVEDRFWPRFSRNRAALVGLIVLAAIWLAALLADLLAPYPFAQQDTSIARQGPTAAHWLGTDELGRDMLSRLLHGARISLAVGVVAQALIVAIGVPVGLAAGYYGRWVDLLLSRLIDVMYSFPDLLLIIVVVTSLRAAFRAEQGGLVGLLASLDTLFGGLLGVFLSLALISWLTLARLVRGETLSLREREFVQAARVSGARGRRVLARHLLPNVLAMVVVAAAFGIPRAIVVEAALSFIGLGVQPPLVSWGTMIFSGANAARAGLPHLILGPAAALAITVLAYQLVGDGLRDALDPWTPRAQRVR
jgi:ABC-type dipeptide/oligopeptide/nickel transport system permease subunit